MHFKITVITADTAFLCEVLETYFQSCGSTPASFAQTPQLKHNTGLFPHMDGPLQILFPSVVAKSSILSFSQSKDTHTVTEGTRPNC